MHPGNCRLLVSVLFAYVIHLTDGCGRTPARTKPAGTTPNPNERTTYAPGGPSTKAPRNQHLLDCTPEEVKQAACLNGGECLVVDAGGRWPHCHCSEMWTGQRCEEIDEGFFVLSADKVEKAGIAAGVVVVVIIVTVVIIYLIIRKRKQRKQRAEANGQANGHAGKALMAGTTFDDDVEKCTDV